VYFALIGIKLDNSSVAFNSVMIPGSSNHKGVERKILALCHNRFFFRTASVTMIIYWKDKICNLYVSGVSTLMLALSIIHVYNAAKHCSSLRERVDNRVPARNTRNFMFCFSFCHCASAANAGCKSIHIFRNLS
jgi:hypothetical protein